MCKFLPPEVNEYLVMFAGLQSTPIKYDQKMAKFTATLSPIASVLHPLDTTITTVSSGLPPPFPTSTSNNNIYQTYVRPKQRAAAQPVVDNPTTQQWPHEFVGADDRQSLTNFEEFEKSMSMCQNEQDFEQMLNNLGRPDGASRDLMRQSLDNIKKRHSLMNLEKQQEDQQRRLNAVDTNRIVSPKSATSTSMDRSSSSILTSSGSGERLLRRSRVCDDVLEESSTKVMSTSSLSDTKENVQNNFDTTISKDANYTANTVADPPSLIPGPDPASTQVEPGSHLVPRPSIPTNTRDRDRFKTIRISKRVPDPAVPHILDEPVIEPTPEVGQMQTDNRTLVEGPLMPRRRLQRPSQLNGLTRRDASLGLTRTIVAPSVIKNGTNATSPMGNKAKSIHNLATGYERSVEKSAEEVNVGNRKEVRLEII